MSYYFAQELDIDFHWNLWWSEFEVKTKVKETKVPHPLQK